MSCLFPLLVLLGVTYVQGARLPFIVGGSNVETPGKWPWQGSLQVIGLSHFCGCVVLSKEWLLSAASCFLLPSVTTVVLLGAHDVRTRLKGDPSYYTIKDIYRHPDFSTENWETGYPNDVGLIRLKDNANTESQFIAPIDLASDLDGDFLSSECYITGWGFTLSGIFPANVLKEAKTKILTNEACDKAWQAAIGPGLIHNTHICTGGSGKEGACSGDSGGPIVCKKDDRWLLVGIVSWGMSTCGTEYPTVSTRVSSYRKWISDTTEGAIQM